jgi:hypothetical protein
MCWAAAARPRIKGPSSAPSEHLGQLISGFPQYKRTGSPRDRVMEGHYFTQTPMAEAPIKVMRHRLPKLRPRASKAESVLDSV